jgi:hypothetical protein
VQRKAILDGVKVVTVAVDATATKATEDSATKETSDEIL